MRSSSLFTHIGYDEQAGFLYEGRGVLLQYSLKGILGLLLLLFYYLCKKAI